MAQVICENIQKKFKDNIVIKDFNLKVKNGEFITLVGPSGCGKSTTLRMIAGLEEITNGKLYIGNKLANDIPPKKRNIGMVFQSYALFPHLTVASNITFGLKLRKFSNEEKIKKLKWALDLLGLNGLENRYPRELSGGQRQRVALGRALVLNPEVLLLDEPLSNLDAKLRLKMRTEFKKLHKKTGYTVIYVTHDQVEAMTLSDRIAILHNGILQQVGSPEEVYNTPLNTFVAGFIGSPPINFIDVEIVKENNKTFIINKDFKIELTKEISAILNKTNKKNLTVGIRPHSFYLKKYKNKEYNKNKYSEYKNNNLKLKVDVIETLGSEFIVVSNIANVTLKIVMNENIKLSSDDIIEVGLKVDKIHFFDPETGNLIK